VTQKSTFENATKKWYPEVKNSSTNAQFVFVGNKIDLRDDR
jgi:GTPase SAR1 family protein